VWKRLRRRPSTEAGGTHREMGALLIVGFGHDGGVLVDVRDHGLMVMGHEEPFFDGGPIEVCDGQAPYAAMARYFIREQWGLAL
jgi:hypothetical protein